jgi:hypothetical protein
MSDVWSESENSFIISDYFEMLLKESEGLEYVKAEHRRTLKRQLENRSASSIEYKHQNISAVLAELGLPYVEGYKPAKNYQSALRAMVESFLRDNPEILTKLFEAAANTPPTIQQVLPLQEVQAPTPKGTEGIQQRATSQATVTRSNYLQYEANNKALGDLGEKAVLAYEQHRLRRAGRPDLASQVEWTAKVVGEGVGYDIHSFDTQETPRFIEVKTTKHGIHFPFFLTSNEVRFSEAHPDSYYLYRVFSYRSQPKLYIRAGAVTVSFILEPHIYRAWP